MNKSQWEISKKYNITSQNTPISTMEQAPNTGISILVAGGGIAGLSFAIEAHRKGHNVKIIERRPPGESTGV
jgi:NADPH-dependent 2,4-dienoyl-CoA reductase/sulfur reductase-like enzyme